MTQATNLPTKRLFIVAHILLLALLFNISIVSAQTTHIVDNTDPSCNAAGPVYCTIPDAVTAAVNGDTIQVAPGIYTGNVIINKALTLLGNNAGINPNNSARNPETVLSNTIMATLSSNITIDGFMLDGGGTVGYGIGGGWSVHINDVTVTNNIITNYTDYGIYLSSISYTNPSENFFVTNNLIQDIGGIGIIFSTNPDGEIENNIVENVAVGIYLFYSDSTAHGKIYIHNNIIYQSTIRGIWVNAAGTIPATYDVQVTNNSVWANGGRGIDITSIGNQSAPIIRDNDIDGAERGYDVWIYGTAHLTIEGGTVTNTTYGIRFSDSTTPPAGGGSAFYGVRDPSTLTLRGTTFSNNTVGIHFIDSFSGRRDLLPAIVEGTNQRNLTLTVDNAFIANNDTGILVEVDSPLTISGTTYTPYTPGDQMFLTVHDSNILDNTVGLNVTSDIEVGARINITSDNCIGNPVDIHNDSPVGTIDATSNWWEGTSTTAGSGNTNTSSPNAGTPPVDCNVVIPIPNNDNFSTPFNTPLLNADVVSNDIDVNPASITIASSLGGVATANSDGTINFTPALDFFGNAYVYYDISNPAGTLTRQGLARIEVLPPNPAYTSTPAVSATVDVAVGVNTPFTVQNTGTGTLSISNIISSDPTLTVSTTTFDVGSTGVSFDVFCSAVTSAPITLSVDHNGMNISSPAEYTINCVETPLVANVLDQDGASLNAQNYTVTRDAITILFDMPVFDDGGAGVDPDSASNPDNYILLEQGNVAGFQTASCIGGVSPDDQRIVQTSTVYSNSSTSTVLTFVPPLGDGVYRLLICGTTSIVSAANPAIALNNGLVDTVIDFTITLPSTSAPTPLQPEDLNVEFLPPTGETPLWAEILRQWFGW